MSVLKLTDLTIKSLSEGVYFDEKTPGFGLLVGKRRKTWLVVKGTGRVRVRIGHYPDLSLADARRRAMVSLGSPFNPSHAPNFPEALDAFLEGRKKVLRPRSYYQLQRTLRRYFHWTKPIDKITHNDVATVIDGIDAKSEAAHTLKDIRAFFNACVPRYIPHSPCTGLKPPHKSLPRTRFLSDTEFKAVWNAAANIGYQFGTMCQLLMINGRRRNQIASLEWDWIDEDNRSITFPASIMKGGLEHWMPYSDLTASILETIPRTGNYLFPARGKDKPATNQGRIKQTLDQQSGVSGFTIHDLRRTVAVQMQKCSISTELIETAFAHRSGIFGGIVGTYQRHDFRLELRAAVEKWENALKKIVEET